MGYKWTLDVNPTAVLLLQYLVFLLQPPKPAPVMPRSPAFRGRLLCGGGWYVSVVFTFMLSHHPLIKSTSWGAQLSFAFITVNLYWVWLWLDLFYHELQCLVSPWSLKVLYIYVLWSQKGLARYYLVISYYDYFEKVLSSEFYYYGSLADYAIDMSKHETYALSWIWLVHNLC